ncbi:SDR family oxidoreductase [Mumia sp. ZJ1417]|uniref:SDR family oxidoreductase n=1 Tax=Mumia sp. ZJ1417 TaxID=2708082 RepID=UPI001420D366|nr:SDR family oxidoreductase [Mumia sp. ZJ1417]QMW65378.1 SDR family oxidoreductase [Mumia sp. ZJ1417]
MGATTVLCLGGTGSVGRLVVAELTRAGGTARVLTRDPRRARSIADPAVEIAGGDFSDVASVAAALTDVEAVVMTHGAPYGSGDYEAVDYGAVRTLVEALGDRTARVALMTSIGVTGTGTGDDAADLLRWKRRGERLLRASGLPYTIVRPGWFGTGTGDEERVDLRQGDLTEYGPVRRRHVAETLVHALRTPAATGRTVEVFSVDGPPLDDWEAAFASTDPDPLPSTASAFNGAHDRATLPLDQEPAGVLADLRHAAR